MGGEEGFCLARQIQNQYIYHMTAKANQLSVKLMVKSISTHLHLMSSMVLKKSDKYFRRWFLSR